MRKGKGWLLCASSVIPFFFILGICPSLAQEKYVTYLSLADYTGAIAGLNVPADQGVEDYITELNNVRGGVEGVKIKFIGVDTRYDVARAVSAYKRYRNEPKLLVMNTIGTPLAKAIAPLAAKDKVIQLTAGDGEFEVKKSRIFLWSPSYQDCFGAAVDWMIGDWKAKGKSGMPKIGFIGWDNPMGKEFLKGGKEYVERTGCPFLKPEFFPPGALDHTVYLTRLANGGANYIFASGVDPTPTNVIRDAHKLGLTRSIQFVNDFWGPTEPVGVRAHPDVLEGTVITSYYIRGGEAKNHPLAQLWAKYRKKPLADMNETYVCGMIWILDFEEALRIALKEVPYEKLDGDVIFKAYQKLAGFHRQGLAGPNAYSPTSRRGSRDLKFYRVKDARVVPITGWIKAPDAVSLYNW
jgi:branched-chain amino acid transport system substrate-binding protein